MKQRIHVLATCWAAAGLVAVAQPLLAQPNPDDIFVEQDTDAFDPGLPVGAQFPEIRALYQGREVTRIDEFLGERGLAFFALRSVDW